MLCKNQYNDSDLGFGDCLWRTSMAYIAYGDSRLKKGIIKSFRKFTMANKKGYWYQASRCYNRYQEDDVSRDQVILALAALKLNGDEKELKEITTHLPSKLSRRFRMSFVLRLWMKAITTNSKWYNFLFHFFELVEFIPAVLWNKIFRPLALRNKQYDPEWYMSVDTTMKFWYEDWNVANAPQWVWITNPEDWAWININNGQKLKNNYKHKIDNNRILKILGKILYPGYALHLCSWMTYTSGKSILKKLLQKFILLESEKSNLLIHLMMDKYITDKQIKEYKPMSDYRWSSRMDGATSFKFLDGPDAKYNVIDKDILLKLKEKIKTI